MTLCSVYHTKFEVVTSFTVSYITPTVWYQHFIFYSVVMCKQTKVQCIPTQAWNGRVEKHNNLRPGKVDSLFPVFMWVGSQYIIIHFFVYYPTRDLQRRLGLLKHVQGDTIFINLKLWLTSDHDSLKLFI